MWSSCGPNRQIVVSVYCKRNSKPMSFSESACSYAFCQQVEARAHLKEVQPLHGLCGNFSLEVIHSFIHSYFFVCLFEFVLVSLLVSLFVCSLPIESLQKHFT